MDSVIRTDVVIVGGGPAGSTCAGILRKYDPEARVLILEKERFPRDHVGESQLPGIGTVLNEMGAWDKVEAAGFPIKVGATYRWGQSPDLWDFDFVPTEFADEPRPARWEGQRRFTAFQVDRAEYDRILLDHAASLGADVRQEHAVSRVELDPDNPERIARLHVRAPDGELTVEADRYVDASGGVGVLRRALGVRTEVPTALRNIAIWDYWQDAEWAVTLGTGGTRVQVLSIDYGWIWFIPIAPTRTSIGLITNAEYYKQRVEKDGITPEDLYREALAKEPRVTHLTRNAQRENTLRTTKDWSFLSERMAGGNWLLAGESAGFADPILAGGMMLAHLGARECAYVLHELRRKEHDEQWLLDHYTELQRRRIGQHIRFADFWYAGNGQFPDLQEQARKIAKDAGLKLDPGSAFRWLSTGGLGNDHLGFATLGGLDIAATKEMITLFVGRESKWAFNQYNVFKLNLNDATLETAPYFDSGRIVRARRYTRAHASLTLVGMFGVVFEVIRRYSSIHDILRALRAHYARVEPPNLVNLRLQQALQVMEVMLTDGWLWGQLDKKKPLIRIQRRTENAMIRASSAVAPEEHAGNDPIPA